MQNRKKIVAVVAFGLMTTGAGVAAHTTSTHHPAEPIRTTQPTTPRLVSPADRSTPTSAPQPTTPAPVTAQPTTAAPTPSASTQSLKPAAKPAGQPAAKPATTPKTTAAAKPPRQTTVKKTNNTPRFNRLQAWNDAVVMTAGVHESGDVPVLANDPGAAGAHVSIVKKPRVGTAQVLPDGRIRYQRVGKGLRPDRLVYRITDARGRTATATLKIKMRAPGK